MQLLFFLCTYIIIGLKKIGNHTCDIILIGGSHKFIVGIKAALLVITLFFMEQARSKL